LKFDESKVPQRTPCIDCGSAYSTVVAPLYVVSVGAFSFRWPGTFRSLCEKHAKERALPALIISTLFGPLGIPWGVLWAWEAFHLNLDEGGVRLDSKVLRVMRQLEAANQNHHGSHPFDVLMGLICGGLMLATIAWRTELLTW